MLSKMNKALLIMAAGCILVQGANFPIPYFHSLVTTGWNEKPATEFTVARNGSFLWRSGPAERKGVVEPAKLAELIAHVEAAKPGPMANDAGMLQVTWQNKSGKPVNKVFCFPNRMPASGLANEIDALAAKYGKATFSEERK